MALRDLVIRSQLVPPRQRRGVVRRPRLEARLMDAFEFPLTVVQAGTGYGKSTALAAMTHVVDDLFWYTITEPDRDPALFLAHLICACERAKAFSCESVLQSLENAAAPVRPDTLTPLINALTLGLEKETLLVLDDFHLVADVPEIGALLERLIDYCPPRLHVVISTRQRPALATLTRWQIKGRMMTITRDDLAFTADEIGTLFAEQYGYPVSRQQAELLLSETEGWAIALQMIWQSVQSGAAASIDAVLHKLPSTMEALFDYLAEEVLARQPSPVQRFLLRTSVLRRLEPAACDDLLEWDGSAALLAQLHEEGFFVVRMGDAYRYHHLFHAFLRQRAATNDPETSSLHQRAGEYYQRVGNLEEAIYHWLAAGELSAAAQMMVQASEALVRDGRVDTMSEWVTALPLPVLEGLPVLMYRMAELCRFASRFDEALAWYEQARERYRIQKDVAGESRALRGQAAVYLDTVRPIKAESLLREALQLVDGQPYREERARLLELMAENMTNRGRWEEAASLRRQAQELREEGPGWGDLDVRVLLRTGRLDEASSVLEERVAAERESPERFRAPRAHRETLLVLSLVYAFQGQAEGAFTHAQEGIELGRRLGSPFVEAVGYMRLGHAWQINSDRAAFEQALACYQRAMDIGDRLGVLRTKVEALWGLCRLYGMSGDLAAAERCAHEGMDTGTNAGDEWIAALIGTMLGASYAIAGRQEDADSWLLRSATALRDCGDPFGQAAAILWRCLLYHKCAEEPLISSLASLLDLAEKHHYDFLFQRRSFLGPPDPSLLVPLLILARQQKVSPDYASRLLESLSLPADLEFHPGYALHVRSLGSFGVLRGDVSVADSEWHREKARQLLQLLLTNRGRFLQREQILDLLWPDADTATADRLFKVVLNTLQGVLEPERPPRAPTLFVQRRDAAYGLNPTAPLWIDASAFEHVVNQAEAAEDAGRAAKDSSGLALKLYQQALHLYQGDYLSGCLYDDWCRDERDRLRLIYLRVLTSMAKIYLDLGDAEEAIRLCWQALASDSCLEAAYQVLMRACLQQGRRAEALRVYERCVARLRDELDVQPMPETVALYDEIHGLGPE
jgi:LuxR family maltose regulon positive regulatory protein